MALAEELPVDQVVDVHSHIYVPAYVDYLRQRAVPPFVRQVDGIERFMLFPGDIGVALDESFTSIQSKTNFMDKVGITHTILSLGNPWLDLESGHESVALAKQINNQLVAEVGHDPSRLSALGVLPNHDIASAIEVVEMIRDSESLVGIVTSTKMCGYELASEELRELWKVIADSRLPVLVHPVSGIGGAATNGYGQALTLGLSFPFETTASISRLVLSGLFESLPELQVIAAHGAGAIPYLYGRLHRAVESDAIGAIPNPDLPPGLLADSILFSDKALRACLDVFGPDNIVFGTDHPFPIADAPAALRDVRSVTGSDEQSRTAILSANARRLFNFPS